MVFYIHTKTSSPAQVLCADAYLSSDKQCGGSFKNLLKVTEMKFVDRLLDRQRQSSYCSLIRKLMHYVQ